MAKELGHFVPKHVFDMHMHIYRKADLAPDEKSPLHKGGETEGIRQVTELYKKMLPGTSIEGGLAIGFPTAGCDMAAFNRFVADETKAGEAFRGSVLIEPKDEGAARELVESNPCIIGLKPYHIFADRKATWDASIPEYLPEWAFKLADEKELIITLHMVKDEAIADPENQRVIRQMCDKYPKAKLILAHAARCFHAPNAQKGLRALAGLGNIWFDSSGICEVEPLMEILSKFGPKKLLWGSDYPVCCIRGRVVTLGHDFIWLDDDTVCWDNAKTRLRPVIVGLESLRALRAACKYTSLTRDEIQEIFFGNAKELLKV